MLRNLSEMIRYRSLIWALVCRHLHARYRGSFLGFIWSFLNPLCLIAVYSLVFQYYIPLHGVDNYTLFLFAGLLPWIWFSSGLLEATSSISGGGSLITKAMFPAHILPVVSIVTNLFNFLFAVPLLLIFMLWTGVIPSLSLIALPIVILIEMTFLIGLGLMFSALNVYYRDIQHILGNLMTLWFFLCPIIYPKERVPAFLLMLNPIAMFTDMYRQVFIQGEFPGELVLLYTSAIALLSFAVGNIVFNRYREDFAELI